MHRPQTLEGGLEAARERLVGQVLVRPHRVAPVVGHLPGVEQRVGGRCRQIAQVAVPGIGEVQDVRRLLDDPDDVGPVLERVHERRDVAPAEEVGDALEVVEGQVLLGQEHHEVVGQRLAHAVELRRLRDLGQVDAGDRGAERARDRFDLQIGTPRHARVRLTRGRGARRRCARRSARGSARRNRPPHRRRPRTAACHPRDAGSRWRT